jgi:hypothetical protein
VAFLAISADLIGAQQFVAFLAYSIAMRLDRTHPAAEVDDSHYAALCDGARELLHGHSPMVQAARPTNRQTMHRSSSASMITLAELL